MIIPACYLVFAPDVAPILPLAYHAHQEYCLGEIPDEIVIPMSSCLANPGVVEISLDQANNIIIVTPVGGGAPLASIFVNNKASALDEESKAEWCDETVN